jgi:hypothetical protein
MTRHARLKQRAVDLGVCIYSGCGNQPEEDSMMCERHHADEKRRKRESKRRTTAFRRRQIAWL